MRTAGIALLTGAAICLGGSWLLSHTFPAGWTGTAGPVAAVAMLVVGWLCASLGLVSVLSARHGRPGPCGSAAERKAATPPLFVSLALFALGTLSVLGADFGFRAVGLLLPVSDVDGFARCQYRFWYGSAFAALIATTLRRELPAAAGATVGGCMVLIWVVSETIFRPGDWL